MLRTIPLLASGVLLAVCSTRPELLEVLAIVVSVLLITGGLFQLLLCATNPNER